MTHLLSGVASVFSKTMGFPTASKFTYRLGTGLKAGVDLVALLQSEAGLGPPKQREAVRQLVDGVKRGESLSSVMAKENYFPRVMTAMTRVGEETGRLERALLALSEHYQHQITTRRAFVTSIIWPALQLVAGILVISLLIWLMGILTPAGGGKMPDMLGFGLRGSSGVLWFWFYLSLFFAACGAMIWAFIHNVAGVQNLIPLVYMVPFIGPAIQTITISRFCWTMSLALGSGLDPIRSISLALDSTGSDYYRGVAGDAERSIRDGASLSGAIEATGLFPDDFAQRVDIAEQSGTDAESLEHLTREYDERAKQAVKVIAGVATIVIRVAVMMILIFLIYRLMSFVFGFYQSTDEPLEPHRRF